MSSGRVLYSLAGHPAFPVRLASEIFQRCMASRAMLYGQSTPCTLYDPCCGAGYQLSVLGFLHRNHIRELIASDVDARAVDQARKNLGLLTPGGLDRRIDEITRMLEQYDKESHRAALASAYRLKKKIMESTHAQIQVTNVFRADATDPTVILKNIPPGSVDLVFTDVPYGLHSSWQDLEGGKTTHPIHSLLSALKDVLSPTSIVAIVSDKKQKISSQLYERLEQFQIGKRRVVMLKAL